MGGVDRKNDPLVLVVDDEASVRQALERALRLEGFAVSTAAGGREALEALEARPPDVGVLDVTMPDLDGIQVVKRMRAGGVDVPVCILSARDDVDDRVAGLQAGADDYLVKPFALAELTARLPAPLRRPGAEAPGAPTGRRARSSSAPSSSPRAAISPPATGATCSSPAASTSCWRRSRATRARSSRATSSCVRCGATTSTSRPTWSTCSWATCGASWRPAASRACCTRCAASGGGCGREGAVEP